MELQTLIAQRSGKLPPGLAPQAGRSRRPELSGPRNPLQKGSVAMELVPATFSVFMKLSITALSPGLPRRPVEPTGP